MTEPKVPTSVPGFSNYKRAYMSHGRAFSYAHQIDAVLKIGAESVLEVGVGTGIVATALRVAGVLVTTADIQPELCPDIRCSVTSLPLENKVVDVSLCCQVLEHLPFSEFANALRELCRVSRDRVIISIPDIRPYNFIRAFLPMLGATDIGISRPRKADKEKIERAWRTSGHYWEIGYPEQSIGVVKGEILTAGCKIVRAWRVPELSWHHFFELSPT